MQNQINLTPITQFVQTVKAAELGQQREIKLSLAQARLLVLTLTEIQDKLLQDYDTLLKSLKNSTDDEVVVVSLDGGGFSSN
jgi:hypothetical protein